MSPSGPRTTRSTGRGPGSGPGRGSGRARSRPTDPDVASDSAQTEATPTAEASGDRPSAGSPRPWARLLAAPGPVLSRLTTRALALGVVLLVLTISYASSLRIYFDQRHDIAETKIEIAQRQQAVNDLNTEISRWNDPAYVRSQARERLGWVVPGETGYKVIGADGKPVGGGVPIAQTGRPSDTKTEAWWARLFGSIKIADHPVANDPGVTSTSDQPVGPSASPSPPR